MSESLNLIGQRFYNLTVVEELGTKMQWGRNDRYWLCECDCGNFTEASTSFLRSGHKKSCGCRKSSKTKEMRTTHGLSKTRLYKIYHGMKTRCFNIGNPAYSHYGGRGITICDEWLGDDGFNAFREWALLNGYEENLTIDRADNDGDYSPSNCRWIPQGEQTNNTRQNVFLEYNWEVHTLSEWAKIRSISYAAIQKRFYKGYDVSVILGFKPLPHAKIITINGVSKPLNEWTEETGVPYQKAWRRLKKGWTPEEALEFAERRNNGFCSR